MEHYLIGTEPRITIKYDKSLGVMAWGADNIYPTHMTDAISASATASQSALTYANFIFGHGWEVTTPYDMKIGGSMAFPETPDSLLGKTAQDISTLRAFAWKIERDVFGNISAIDHIPASFIRFTEDCERVIVYNNWDKRNGQRIMRNDFKYYDFYTDDKDVIFEQIENAGGYENYNGQILFKAVKPYGIYSLSPIDPVFLDCDSERLASIASNKDAKHSFSASGLVQTGKFDDPEKKKGFINSLKAATGAEGTGRLVLVEDQFSTETPNGNFRFTPFTRTLDSKGAETLDKLLSNRIRRVFNNVPPVLVDQVEGSLGATSGESLMAAIQFYNMQTSRERILVEETFQRLLDTIEGLDNINWVIKPLTNELNYRKSRAVTEGASE